MTPQFFDVLVIAAIAVGVVLMVWRLIHDFRQGQLWSEDSQKQPDRSEKP